MTPAAPPAPGVPGLAHGAAGRALACACLGDSHRAGRLLDEAIDLLGTVRVGPGLWEGAAGVGWAVAHLGVDADFDELDAVLLEWTDEAPDPDHDLVRGLAGVGTYAMARSPAPAGPALLTAVLAALERTAERDDAGARWRTPAGRMAPAAARAHPEGALHAGMAHGTAGVVAFLASAQEAGADGGGLLADAVRWLALQPVQRRAAWCGGELGVAVALARGAAALANTDLAREAVSRARLVATEAPAAEDAGLCHGAAGVALGFARLSALTGPDPVLDAGRTAWAAAAGRLPATGAGLLTGGAGVALALATLRGEADPSWQRVLGLMA